MRMNLCRHWWIRAAMGLAVIPLAGCMSSAYVHDLPPGAYYGDGYTHYWPGQYGYPGYYGYSGHYGPGHYPPPINYKDRERNRHPGHTHGSDDRRSHRDRDRDGTDQRGDGRRRDPVPPPAAPPASSVTPELDTPRDPRRSNAARAETGKQTKVPTALD